MKNKYKNNDALAMLMEWQEHQYNPAHWYNRFRLGFPPKRTKGVWLITFVDLVTIVPSTILLIIAYFFERKGLYLRLSGLFGIFAIFSIMRTIRLRPDPKPPTSQAASDEYRHKLNMERKRRAANRPKGYR